MGRRFSGFNRHGVDLLRELDANNSRAWLIGNERLFHELLFEPALDLILDLCTGLRRHGRPTFTPCLGSAGRSEAWSSK